MTSRVLFITVLTVLASVLLVGCSIKPVPYEEVIYYQDEHYDERYGAGFSLRQKQGEYSDYNYRAWQMSQYYRNDEPGYQAYGDASINTNRSSDGNYRSDEVPVKKAPEQSNQFGQMTQANRVRQRKDDRNQRTNSQSEIGKEQKTIAKKHRREDMRKVRSKRTAEREKSDEMTEEELEKQRQKTLRKKRR